MRIFNYSHYTRIYIFVYIFNYLLLLPSTRAFAASVGDPENCKETFLMSIIQALKELSSTAMPNKTTAKATTATSTAVAESVVSASKKFKLAKATVGAVDLLKSCPLDVLC